MLVFGIILILFSIKLSYDFFIRNEWRIPLLELMFVLSNKGTVVDKKISMNNSYWIMLFYSFFYFIGFIIVYASFYNLIVLILGVFVLILLLKGIYTLYQARHSKEVKLLNYLYSPYIYAWQKDFFKSYSVVEIAKAICKIIDFDITKIKTNYTSLSDFLIELCKATRPKIESERYIELQKNLIKQADQLNWKN